MAHDAAALRRQGAVWALVAWVGTLALLGAAAGPAREGALARPCSMPREASAERAWSRVVTCRTPPGGGRPLRGPARWLFGQRIDLARADARLLEALPGIGPARAAAIVAERRRRPFDSLADLTRVHGIGPKTVARLRPFVRVGPPTRRAAATAPGGRAG